MCYSVLYCVGLSWAIMSNTYRVAYQMQSDIHNSLQVYLENLNIKIAGT